jgi:hypothetical protein
LAGLPPRLTADATVDLALLKGDTLRQLAAIVGEATSGTSANLISRISGRRLPLPALGNRVPSRKPLTYDVFYFFLPLATDGTKKYSEEELNSMTSNQLRNILASLGQKESRLPHLV